MVHYGSTAGRIIQKLKSFVMEDKAQGTGSPEASHGRPGSLRVMVALFNGLGVGLLLGLLLGLSLSPVVSGIIGTVSSLLVVMIGLNEKFMSPLKSIRIGAFGVFAVAGILSGIYIRSNNILSPSLAELKEEYLEVGYSEREALDFISMMEFDLVPSEWRGGEAGGKVLLDSATMSGKRRSNILFSSEIDIGQCYLVETVNEDMPLSEVENTFILAGGTWKDLAEGLDEELPENIRKGALLSFRDSFCRPGSSGTLELQKCSAAASVDMTLPLRQVKSALSDIERIWSRIIENLENRVDPAYQKSILITTINVFCHEDQ